MEYATIAGNYYTITSKSGCTVTDATGTLNETVDAGKQLTVQAPSDKLIYDDEQAIVFKATFKHALAALGLLGGGTTAWLKALKKELAVVLDGASVQYKYSPSKKYLLILTDLGDDTLNTVVLTACARHAPQDTTYEVFNTNKYAECKTVDDMIAVNSDYINDLTEDGEWVYPLTSMTGFRSTSDWWTGIFAGSPMKKMNGVFPACTYCHALFGGTPQMEEYDLEFPIATRVSATSNQAVTVKKARLVAPESTFMERCFYYNTQLSELYVYAPKVNSIGLMFSSAFVLEEIMGEFGAEATSLDGAFSRCYKLQVFPTYYPKAASAAGMLNECRISAESAIAILDSMPTWTDGASHPITIGIHIDHQNDEEVIAAVTAAEEKGWTVTVQWNGTPTAQTVRTFRLRKPPIYAKLGTMEYPDGTTEHLLDWGHYVTNAEENGYMEFASIEEAKEYFNITE